MVLGRRTDDVGGCDGVRSGLGDTQFLPVTRRTHLLVTITHSGYYEKGQHHQFNVISQQQAFEGQGYCSDKGNPKT